MPILAATLLVLGSAAQSEPIPLKPMSGRVDQPVELGQVKWRRDFEAGLAEAKRSGKPALLQFQEVPG